MSLTMPTAVRYYILLQNPQCSLPCSQQFATISCYKTLNVPYYAHSSSLLYPVTEPWMFLTMLTSVRYYILLQNPECSLPCSHQFATISSYKPHALHFISLLFNFDITSPQGSQLIATFYVTVSTLRTSTSYLNFSTLSSKCAVATMRVDKCWFFR
jgi:hypothetical protein